MTIILAVVGLALLCCIRIIRPGRLKVIDGDTVQAGQRRWRITGYDAPEWNQPHGGQASKALRKRITGKYVFAIVSGTDEYGRLKTRLFTSSGPVAWHMIVSGHAHADGFVGRVAEIFARLMKRGMWALGGVIHPSHWRGISR